MTMPIEEIKEYCGRHDYCYNCPVYDECDQIMDDVYNVPFGFVLTNFKKKQNERLIQARLVFDQPIVMPLKISGLMSLKDPGVYLVYAPERELEIVEKEMKKLKEELERLESRKRFLTYE